LAPQAPADAKGRQWDYPFGVNINYVQPPLKDMYNEWRARVICYAFSVPIALTINNALRREQATLDYYNTGSEPDSFATLPKEWMADQIRQFQD
jgi:hypothetical protein